MTFLMFIAVVLAHGDPLAAQERETTPTDSTRISIPGCAKDRTFIVGARSEHEPIGSDVEPGRRFRLSGPKKILDDIKKREGTMVEITGLVRKAQLSGPGGVTILGGRIRIGGAVPQDPIADPRRDPLYNQVVIDVESWRPLPESCSTR